MKIETIRSFKEKERKNKNEIIEKLPEIRRLIDEGKNNIDVIRIVWGKDCDKNNSKNITVKNIRENKIFKEIP